VNVLLVLVHFMVINFRDKKSPRVRVGVDSNKN
jgi:hypothetical protein